MTIRLLLPALGLLASTLPCLASGTTAAGVTPNPPNIVLIFASGNVDR